VAGTPAAWWAGTEEFCWRAGGAAWVDALRLGCEREGAGPERRDERYHVRRENMDDEPSPSDAGRTQARLLTGMVASEVVAKRKRLETNVGAKRGRRNTLAHCAGISDSAVVAHFWVASRAKLVQIK
jgi:hypothetical protein